MTTETTPAWLRTERVFLPDGSSAAFELSTVSRVNGTLDPDVSEFRGLIRVTLELDDESEMEAFEACIGRHLDVVRTGQAIRSRRQDDFTTILVKGFAGSEAAARALFLRQAREMLREWGAE